MSGQYHTCGLQNDGTLLCWGDIITASQRSSGHYTQVSAGGYLHTCGLQGDGTLLCWGNNDYGQTTVPTGTYTQVSAGVSSHLRSQERWQPALLGGGGDCWCWGQTEVPAGSYTQVSGGLYHTCGLQSDGILLCWGDNTYGQTTVPAGTYTQVSAGLEHTCGLKSDGSLLCWGNNDLDQTTVPVGTFTQVSAGQYHTCGLQNDGTLLCWGDDYYGQTIVPPPNIYGIDTTPPSVSSTRADADPTDATSVDFMVTFSEYVVGVNAVDFNLTTTGSVSGAAITSVIGAGSTYMVTVDRGTGEGTIRLDVLADDSIRDAVNLPLDGGYSSGQFYTIDTTPPTVISSDRADGDPSGKVKVDFTVTFSQAVTGVDPTDFSLTTGGAVSGAFVTGVSGSGDTYTVTVNTGIGDGTIRLDVLDDDSIEDGDSNSPGRRIHQRRGLHDRQKLKVYHRGYICRDLGI